MEMEEELFDVEEYKVLDAVEIQRNHMDKFTLIHDKEGTEVNPIPKDVRVTVYCDDEPGGNAWLVLNTTVKELGLEELIAVSWILEEDLQKLFLPKSLTAEEKKDMKDEAMRYMVQLLPPEQYGEHEECEAIQNILEELAANWATKW